MKSWKPVIALCLTFGLTSLAQARPVPDQGHGKRLYQTYCNACHDAQIHWRDKHLATDLHSLDLQVRHWQATLNLRWNEDDINDVAHYLNAVYYHFTGNGKDITRK